MVQISEIKGDARGNRTAAHTHIKGLGLRADGTAEPSAGGFVGQTAAREVRSPVCSPLISQTYLSGLYVRRLLASSWI